MARQLFISQDTLATWQDQDKIEFDGHVMTIKADGRRFELLEAVRFIRIDGEGTDPAGMIGKVKTNKQLEVMGAERYRDSVLLGETAYKVQEGFIGEVFVRSGALDTGQVPVVPLATVSGLPPVPEVPPAPAGKPAPPPPPIQDVAPAPAGNGETVREAARRAAEATAQSGEPQVKAAVMRIPMQRRDRDLAAARTQPSLPVVREGDAPPTAEAALEKTATPVLQPGTAAQPAAPAAVGEKKPAEGSDEDLLTKFLLDNL